ncbi:MAG: hypothetical protein P0Y59_24030 [Candidatus Sphingomonas phytovorans]|nr:hypothetical protein [Sphingomonas sp.]WEJ99926.1 MAG: hypothetical protein P0Y59_24030 [Sphingomonas sp.]
MVDSTRRQRLNLPVAPLVAAVIGGVIALAFALIPTGLLEDLVIDSGLAAVIPAAAPPLGVTARAVLILAAGGGTALIAWFGLFLLLGDRAIVVQKSGEADDGKAPVLRRADAHPDAPARRPLSANRELGTPFLEVRAQRPVHTRADEPEDEIDDLPMDESFAERDLPANLDMPLAAYDPHAIPEEPVDWSPQLAPLLSKPRQQVFDPGERFETFELTPLVRNATPAPAFMPELEPVAQPERLPAPVPLAVAKPIQALEPTQASGPIYAPAPIAPPEPMPAFAPTEAREPEPAYTPVPIVAPEPTPAFAPTPAREPSQFFKTSRPLRPERPVEEERPFAPARPRASARVETDPSASIHALLDRLERGVGRRETIMPPAPPQNEDSLQEALVTLRRLATRG